MSLAPSRMATKRQARPPPRGTSQQHIFVNSDTGPSAGRACRPDAATAGSHGPAAVAGITACSEPPRRVWKQGAPKSARLRWGALLHLVLVGITLRRRHPGLVGLDAALDPGEEGLADRCEKCRGVSQRGKLPIDYRPQYNKIMRKRIQNSIRQPNRDFKTIQLASVVTIAANIPVMYASANSLHLSKWFTPSLIKDRKSKTLCQQKNGSQLNMDTQITHTAIPCDDRKIECFLEF